MGYTHYWSHPAIGEEEWAALMRDALVIITNMKKRGIAITGWDGTGKPEIVPDMIRFNGADPDDYETFAIGRNHTPFDFCKTEYRPYDLAVMLMLLAAHRRIEGFAFNSDGDWDGQEWREGRQVYAELFGPDVLAIDAPSPLRSTRA
jgi:hypothetical protein